MAGAMRACSGSDGPQVSRILHWRRQAAHSVQFQASLLTHWLRRFARRAFGRGLSYLREPESSTCSSSSCLSPHLQHVLIGPLLWHLCQLDRLLQIFNSIILECLLGHNLCSRAELGCLLQHSDNHSAAGWVASYRLWQNIEGHDLMMLMS